MSYAAVHEVTRGLRILLHSSLTGASPTAAVTLLPPGETPTAGTGVNLYLYRVAEEPAHRNVADRPRLALQLYYLLTPFAGRPDDSSFSMGDDAHTMLGLSMLTLHEHPVLTSVHEPGFDADVVLPEFLRADRARVTVTLLPTSVDDIAKIWSAINQPYRLSVAYEVSLVELSASRVEPVAPGVVATTGLRVEQLAAPRIGAVVPAAGALARLDGGAVVANRLRLEGSGLVVAGQPVAVTVGGRPVRAAPDPAPDGPNLTVELPADLDVGPDAEVVAAAGARVGPPAAFAVRPWLASATPVRTALDPADPSTTMLELRGAGFPDSGLTVLITSAAGQREVPPEAGSTATAASVALPDDLPNGRHHVRVVAGADDGRPVSNPRPLHVVPRVDPPVQVEATTVDGQQVHRLSLTGARLAGADVEVLVDGVPYRIGATEDPAALQVTLGRRLAPGRHAVAARVEGSLSHPVDLVVG